jgi:hypothetical protein
MSAALPHSACPAADRDGPRPAPRERPTAGRSSRALRPRPVGVLELLHRRPLSIGEFRLLLALVERDSTVLQLANVPPRTDRPTVDQMSEWSFPASDPPAVWTWEVSRPAHAPRTAPAADNAQGRAAGEPTGRKLERSVR